MIPTYLGTIRCWMFCAQKSAANLSDRQIVGAGSTGQVNCSGGANRTSASPTIPRILRVFWRLLGDGSLPATACPGPPPWLIRRNSVGAPLRRRPPGVASDRATLQPPAHSRFLNPEPPTYPGAKTGRGQPAMGRFQIPGWPIARARKHPLDGSERRGGDCSRVALGRSLVYSTGSPEVLNAPNINLKRRAEMRP